MSDQERERCHRAELAWMARAERAEAQVAAVERVLDDHAGSDHPEHAAIRAALATSADTPTEPDADERVQAVARRMERLRQSNPINGDCSNSTLSRAQQALVDEFPECLAAIEDERLRMRLDLEEQHLRLEQENQRRRDKEARDG